MKIWFTSPHPQVFPVWKKGSAASLSEVLGRLSKRSYSEMGQGKKIIYKYNDDALIKELLKDPVGYLVCQIAI